MAKSVEMIQRDEKILEMAAAGYTQRDIASTLGISAARVNQILKAHWSAFDDDADRQNQRELMDSAIKVTAEYMLGPGQMLIAANGRPVYDILKDEDGNAIYHNQSPVPDLNKPLFDKFSKVKAASELGRLLQARSRMFGTERKAEADTAAQEEFVAEVISTLEQGAAENARLKELLASHGIDDTVEGEIVQLDSHPSTIRAMITTSAITPSVMVSSHPPGGCESEPFNRAPRAMPRP